MRPKRGKKERERRKKKEKFGKILSGQLKNNGKI